MKTIKKIFAAVLAVSMILSNMPVQMLMAVESKVVETVEPEVVETIEPATVGIEETEPRIINVVFRSSEVFEGTGYIRQGYSEKTQSYQDYVHYYYAINCTVTFADGTVVKSSNGWIDYNDYSYYTGDYCTDKQGPDNEWGKGDHEVTFELLGYKATCVVAVVENPIESFVCEDIDIIEGTNGGYTKEYDEETESYKEYFHYYATPTFEVKLKDGTVINQHGGFEYKGEYYYIGYSTNDQSYDNQWTVGNTYSGTASLFGISVEYDVTIVESPVESVVCKPMQIVENTRGEFWNDYDDQTDDYLGEYFHYFAYPEFTITFKDGTVIEEQQGGTTYHDEWYDFTIITEQSYHNQWEVGNQYNVKASILGKECEYTVEIVGSPIVSFECKDMELLEGSQGQYVKEYNPETDSYEEYFHYYFYPTFDITFNDGTQLLDCKHGFAYQGEYYYVNASSMQGVSNPMMAGNTYSVEVSVLGITDVFSVTIIETPVQSIEVDDVTIIEGSQQSTVEEWDVESQSYIEYTVYDYSIENGMITMKDGSTYEIQDSRFYYNGEYQKVHITDDQSYSNKWGLGTHTATISAMGVRTTINVEIIESPYVTIEILNVADVTENRQCWYDEDVEHVIYQIPDFTYKITLKDGSTRFGYYNEYENNNGIQCYSNQYEEPWTVDGSNYFYVEYMGLQVCVPVEMHPVSEYDYFVDEGQVFITGYNRKVRKLEIPSEIDGMPVVGLFGLGSAAQYVEELIIPNSVITLSEDVFWEWDVNLKSLTIGSGVSYIHYEMFTYCEQLERITISEDNETYCSIDDVIYSKSGEEVIFYPLTKGTVFKVPEKVTNIDVLNEWLYMDLELQFDKHSTAFIIEDGVTYNAAKTKIISCDPKKTGEYVMPSSVEEIVDYAFLSCTNITKVVISDNVKEIPVGAFSGCSSLTEVNFPVGLQIINSSSFDSTSLVEVVIPGSVRYVGADAFWGVPIQKLVIEEGVETIDFYAFARTSIKSVVIPNSVTDLREGAFCGCEQLEEVVIGTGVTVIESSMFEYDEELKRVTILGESVGVSNYAFSDCTSLESFDFSNINYIGGWAFANAGLTCVLLAEGVGEVYACAFENCKNLSTVDVPQSLHMLASDAFTGTAWYENQNEGVIYLEHILYGCKGNFAPGTVYEVKKGTKVISGGSFEDCENIIGVILPDGLEVIGNGSFENCTNLAEIHIPASVEYIGWYAFGRCEELTAINVDKDNEYYESVNGVLFNKGCTELYCCPNINRDEYTVPNTVEFIHQYAFSDSWVKKVILTNKDTELDYASIGYSFYSSYPDQQVEIVYPEGSTVSDYVSENLLMSNSVEAISISTLPKHTVYYLGEEFNPDGMVLKVNHVNGMTTYVQNGFGTIDYDFSEGGTKTVTITYGGQSTSLDVQVVENAGDIETPEGNEPEAEKTIQKVEFETFSKKGLYVVGEEFDMEGVSLRVTYTDGTSEVITEGFEIQGFRSDVPWNGFPYAVYKGHIAYSYWEVIVCKTNVYFTEIETLPNKLVYEVGEELDLTGLSIIIYYVDGSWEIISEGFEIVEFDSMTVGTKTVVVKCDEMLDEINWCSFEVTVKEPDGETPEPKPEISGDVDGNGVLTTDDAIYLLYHTNNSSNYPVNQDVDFDGNGYVTSDDAIYLLYHIMMPDKYLIKKPN